MRKSSWLLVFLVFSLGAEESIPRTVLGIYYTDSKKREENPENLSPIEMYAEMPLNHLGLEVIPYNLWKGAPNLDDYPNLRGVVLWLEDSMNAPDIDGLIEQIVKRVDKGMKFISLGELGFPSSEPLKYYAGVQRTNRLLQKIGLHYEGRWVSKVYDVEFIVLDKKMMNFEKEVEGADFSYMFVNSLRQETEIALVAEEMGASKSTSVLVATHPNGGYIAPWYGLYTAFDDKVDKETRSWYVNPFLFFSKALDTDQMPKPDTTTVAGRRIYYSHIDGDGWYNISLIPEYTKEGKICAEVIFEEICLTNPNLPISIGVIGADIDKSWVGKKQGIEAAEKIYALPHIEASTHTFSHPFFWQFFEDYTPDKEEPYLSRYPNGGWNAKKEKYIGTWDKFLQIVKNNFQISSNEKPALSDDQNFGVGYVIPRYYAKQPFNLNLEIVGAANILTTVTPSGKKCELYQWSGNCQPFEAAVALTRTSALPNINGGDTRLDSQYPSYAWVSPIGRLVGKERQIYASNSNENLYTNLWQDEFFGFRDLVQTFKNTDSPIRVKPMNLYYHTFSGERISSLKALLHNINYVKKEKKCPIEASLFAKWAQGFYTTKFYPKGERIWKITNRGELQTIRFDKASGESIDWKESVGIVGQRRFNGSLYIYLDQKEKEPVIALQKKELVDEEVGGDYPYLIESQWLVWNVRRLEKSFLFTTRGYDAGEMDWRVPVDGKYRITFSSNKGKSDVQEVKSVNQLLQFTLPNEAMIEPAEVEVSLL